MGAAGVDLRRHQRLALEALEKAWADGHRRAWVVLPPGAGKTLVGLETARRLLERGQVGTVVALSPNTAIQGQWVRQAHDLGLAAGTARDLADPLTSLTYQSVAVFDPDAEVSEEGEAETLVARLHDNGRTLVERLRAAGPLLLVLDECHHLLEVWGRLLAELLELLPEATVLGLTATPPEALTREEKVLVDALFGPTVFEASIPAVVREGDLAPFAEMVWLTRPTSHELDWLQDGALRFQELVTRLTEPGFGTLPFLEWVDRRFVDRPGEAPSWQPLARSRPALADAALRLHHAGLLALPPGATPVEQHRREPTADDWVELVDDWVTGHLLGSEDPADTAALAAVRRALPSVGYVLTRRGIRAGRTPVDRVLARSESKTTATVAIAHHERLALGDDLRLLVLCDHERATATLPAVLVGVISEQAGSAHAVLASLLADPAGADALLVTGATVAGAPSTLEALVAQVGRTQPHIAAALRVEPGAPVATLAGPWTSRTWVGHVTRFFESGGCHVLVGTRGLLGEGWDARRVTGLVDLTAVTTTTAVVQTRGRALRTDPADPAKVALNWSVVCLAPEHPRGDNDWSRLVRKHTGFFGVDEDGSVVDGVAHLDPAFSPYRPPAVEDIDGVNARMVRRAEDRAVIRERWRVGEPYADRAGRTLRIRPSAPVRLPPVVAAPAPVSVALADSRLDVRDGPARPAWRRLRAGQVLALVLSLVLVALGVGVGQPAVVLAAALGLPVMAALEAARQRRQVRWGRELVAAAAEPPDVGQVAAAVAEGLHAAGVTSAGANALRLELVDGEYRARLGDVGERESGVYATALDEVLAPLASPRYVIGREVVTRAERSFAEARRVALELRVPPDGVVWHALPAVVAGNAGLARAYAGEWRRWLGGGEPLYTGSPEGAGVLASQRGADPFAVTTVMRRQWD